MSWTDERVELLKKLWAEGQSASQIAKELGGVTRNAVIGKVHRLGLSNRGNGSTGDPPATAPASADPANGDGAASAAPANPAAGTGADDEVDPVSGGAAGADIANDIGAAGSGASAARTDADRPRAEAVAPTRAARGDEDAPSAEVVDLAAAKASRGAGVDAAPAAAAPAAHPGTDTDSAPAASGPSDPGTDQAGDDSLDDAEDLSSGPGAFARRRIVPAGQPLPPQPSANEVSPEALATVREVEKSARRLTLLELTERTCKWPVGDPATEDFWFCGLPVQPGKPYCEAHVSVAFQPMSNRRDRRR